MLLEVSGILGRNSGEKRKKGEMKRDNRGGDIDKDG